MHSMLAIETVRSYFDESHEPKAWEEMRQSLKIKEQTIREIKSFSDVQRHGKIVDFTARNESASSRLP
jgi:hypothetical protein